VISVTHFASPGVPLDAAASEDRPTAERMYRKDSIGHDTASANGWWRYYLVTSSSYTKTK